MDGETCVLDIRKVEVTGQKKKNGITTEKRWGPTNNLKVEKVQTGRKYKIWIYLIVL